jgi:4a-hydroxytetrahydrobiopterin dehydratase
VAWLLGDALNAHDPEQKLSRELLSDSQIAARLGGVPHFRREGKTLVATVETEGFLKGLAIVNRVAEAAERLDHHPDVLLTWPRVTFTLMTHDRGGITDWDFKLAAEIERCLEP